MGVKRVYACKEKCYEMSISSPKNKKQSASCFNSQKESFSKIFLTIVLRDAGLSFEYDIAYVKKDYLSVKFFILINNRMHVVSFCEKRNLIFFGGKSYLVEKEACSFLSTQQSAQSSENIFKSKSNNFIESPLSGRVVRVLGAAGDAVCQGQPLVIIESMKMENEICSHSDGIIKTLFIALGNLVEPNQLLVELEMKGGLCGESQRTNDEASVQNW